jgi:hypothetical protein
MGIDAGGKPPNCGRAKLGANLQFVMVLSIIAGSRAYGRCFDGPPISDRELPVILGLIAVSSAGILVGFFGLCLICAALVKDRCRAQWLFWFLVGYGPFQFLIVPWGIPFGIFFIVYALVWRREFFRPVISSTPIL